MSLTLYHLFFLSSVFLFRFDFPYTSSFFIFFFFLFQLHSTRYCIQFQQCSVFESCDLSLYLFLMSFFCYSLSFQFLLLRKRLVSKKTYASM